MARDGLQGPAKWEVSPTGKRARFPAPGDEQAPVYTDTDSDPISHPFSSELSEFSKSGPLDPGSLLPSQPATTKASVGPLLTHLRRHHRHDRHRHRLLCPGDVDRRGQRHRPATEGVSRQRRVSGFPRQSSRRDPHQRQRARVHHPRADNPRARLPTDRSLRLRLPPSHHHACQERRSAHVLGSGRSHARTQSTTPQSKTNQELTGIHCAWPRTRSNPRAPNTPSTW